MGSITAETANRPIANKARLTWTAFRPRRSAADRLDRRIYLLAFAIFATGTDAGVVAGMLPQIAQDFHLGVGVVSQLLTAYAITYAVGSPFFGVVASQYRSERLILVCLLSFASAVALSAVVAGTCRPAGRAHAGRFASPQPTRLPPSHWPRLSPPDRRGAGLSMVGSGFVATQVTSVPIGIWVAYHLGWRVTFSIDMMLVVLAATALWFARLPQTTKPPSISLGARLAPLTRSKTMGALTAKIIAATAVNVVCLFVAVLFGPRYGADAIALFFAVLGLGGLVGTQLGGRLADRFGPTRSICYCLAGVILDLALMNLLASTFGGTIIALFTLTCFSWATFPRLSELSPRA